MRPTIAEVISALLKDDCPTFAPLEAKRILADLEWRPITATEPGPREHVMLGYGPEAWADGVRIPACKFLWMTQKEQWFVDGKLCLGWTPTHWRPKLNLVGPEKTFPKKGV
jgi:hypothetical protein